jgi:hypothetical protein
MGSSSKVHPANGTDSVDQGPSASNRELIDQLVKMDKAEAKHNLGTRHRMGKLLNARLGPPTERQPHGQRVLKEAAEALECSESELNRMRWFAHLFGDVAALRQSHPEIDSWAKFKAALPSLKPVKGSKARKPVKDASLAAFGGVAKSLANAVSKLNGLKNRPRDAERQKIVDALQEVAEAASRCLKIPVDVVVGVKGNKPVAKKRMSRVA